MDDQNLLEILQAHGQNFLDSFSLPTTISGLKKRKRDEDASISSKAQKVGIASYSSEEEWEGIKEAYDIDAEDSQNESSEFEQEDDGFTASSSCVNSKVIVFQDIVPTSKSDRASKHQKKAFMSSKVSKLRQDLHDAVEEKKSQQEEEDERTNAQNDALLHRLVHTKLLSGSLDPSLDMTPAQRRKALAGRVLELSGAVKLGKGEKSVRNQERNKASKRVREGLKEKQKERVKQELEEAKDIGNYHPTLKKLFGDSDTPSIRKREKGLRMGVGNFRGGFLQLGQSDLDRLNGTGRGVNRGPISRGSRGRRK